MVSCILLTTHPKRAHFLPDALRSYRQQDYPIKELVVVNDGIPLSSNCPDITVINLPDRGARWTIGEKRNVGVRYAKGDFLATWDDDDISLPHRLSSQVSFAESTGADYVLADRMHIADQDMNVMGNCDRGKAFAVMPSALIRRDSVVRAGGYLVSDYLEDFGMMEAIRFRCRGKVLRMDGCDWYVMRRHGSNVTLSHGESNDEYISCGLRGPLEKRAAELVSFVRSAAGASDIVEISP
jgi:glycosyltransferase involved in cell wall biosynthesis